MEVISSAPAVIPVTDSTQVGEARRKAAAFAERANFGERDAGALAIAVTEMATNIDKHARGGTIVIESIGKNGSSGVRVLSLDKGPGIKDLNAAIRDGYSSSGTAGNGLGAIKRLSRTFDIYTAPGLGTAVLAEFWSDHEPNQPSRHVDVGVRSVPVSGEDVSGDGWGVRGTADSAVLMVVDGLGHGILAADAATAAENVFRSSRDISPSSILQNSHDAMKKTRGAAMAVVAIHFERRLVTFAGIGNIVSSIIAPDGSRGMASHNGIVGHHVSNIQEFTFPWSADSILVMHSDGLKHSWDLNKYPGIRSKRPALVAGILWRDFTRERDDVTVLVAKNHQGSHL
jgi:anti-sigma regulatory factor (Ser/Thr protein kinase)